MTTHDESPIIRTSPKRMTKGILIVVITLAVGTAIIVPFWETMIHTPPTASTLKHEEPLPLPSGTQTIVSAPAGARARRSSQRFQRPRLQTKPCTSRTPRRPAAPSGRWSGQRRLRKGWRQQNTSGADTTSPSQARTS